MSEDRPPEPDDMAGDSDARNQDPTLGNALVTLPEGYTYAQIEEITPEEIDDLIRQIPAFSDEPAEYLARRNSNFAQHGIEAIDLGVRAPDGTLIGFTNLAFKDHDGELNDIMVVGGHDNQGIGKALMESNFNIAWELEITSLYIGLVEGSNTLVRFLTEDQGFRHLPDGALGRGPNPHLLYSSSD